MSSQKGTTRILIIILVVLVIVAGVYWLSPKSATPVSTTTVPSQIESGIQNDNELMSVANDLDSTDLDTSIDSELSQNDTDATSF